MIIDLKNLANQTLRVRKSLRIGSGRQPAEGCYYAAPVAIDFLLRGKDKEFRLTGFLSTTLICTSHRSLRSFERPVKVEVDILFVPRDKMAEETEVELSSEDMFIQSYVDSIDLRHIVDEQINLALPMRLISPDELSNDELVYSTRARGDEEAGAVDGRLVELKNIRKRMREQK